MLRKVIDTLYQDGHIIQYKLELFQNSVLLSIKILDQGYFSIIPGFEVISAMSE